MCIVDKHLLLPTHHGPRQRSCVIDIDNETCIILLECGAFGTGSRDEIPESFEGHGHNEGYLVLPPVEELGHVVCSVRSRRNLQAGSVGCSVEPRQMNRRCKIDTYRVLPALDRVCLALGDGCLNLWDRQPRFRNLHAARRK
jgi:hypothetical protein